MSGTESRAEVPIPKALRSRPRWRGWVIPYATFIDDQGVPQFRILDVERAVQCIQKRLCGVCGGPIPFGEWICFIGGPASIKSRVFADPGMHTECALYSALTCPYLSCAEGHHRDILEKIPGAVVHRDPLASDQPERPARMAIYYCKGYDILQAIGSPGLHARAYKQPRKIDWDTMPARRAEGNAS